MHWAFQYIGKPWVSGARGPDAFDCWGLLYEVYKVRYGVTLPLYDRVSARDILLCTRLISAGAEQVEWQRTEAPFEGCAVGLSQNRLFHHVGIYLEVDGGMILHAADKKSTTAQSPATLKSQGWNRIEYFFHHGACYTGIKSV
jgi:cell wall-associated NlpC family hydrolase